MASLSAAVPVRAVAGRAARSTGRVAPARLSPFLGGSKINAVAPTARTVKGRGQLVVRAEEEEGFDSLLTKGAEAFEKAENKPVLVGYGVAALLAFFATEWLIHLPGLDILLGFPAELVGVLVGPVLALRYLKNGKSIATDVTDVVEDLAGILPGLKK
eukprot:CAMPEP_0182880500 /NCGR_PEP_ID=MMETSP0034_2-20130328/16601_1 /TAXON_ID=156128 /ORGANISM="Nephroselmis pyriformis, Strain CCMP717" /LENGTH=157 /DNA_ID=CAMNT_0025013487 /DNA_START=1 /DNA_END=474 /DNA_ORIENTATION=-